MKNTNTKTIEVTRQDFLKGKKDEAIFNKPLVILTPPLNVRVPLSPEQLMARKQMCIVNLFKAVVAQAIEDYRSLEGMKLVKNGKLRKPWKKTKVCDGAYSQEAEAKSLVNWLRGKGLEETLDACHEEIHPDYIRRHIGIGG